MGSQLLQHKQYLWVMKRNLIVFGALVIGIHLLGVLESCIFRKCELEPLYRSADDVKVGVYSKLESTVLFDRNSLSIGVRMHSEDWQDSYLGVYNAGILSSAEANDCPDSPKIFLEFIESLEVLLRYDESGIEINKNITNDFVAEGGEDRLYIEIEKLLINQSTTSLSLVYKEVPQGDSLGMIIKTRLSDDRIFSDTLNIQLK